MYRAEIKDRDEWIAALKARHREQEVMLLSATEMLRRQVEEWAPRADRSIALVEGAAGKLDEAGRLLAQSQGQFLSLLGDYVECAMLLIIFMRLDSHQALQQDALGLLGPNGRAVIEAGLAWMPARVDDTTPPFDFAHLRNTVVLPLIVPLSASPK